MNNTIKNLLGFATFVSVNVGVGAVALQAQVARDYEAKRPQVEFATRGEAHTACMKEVAARPDLTHCELYTETLERMDVPSMARSFFGPFHSYPEVSHYTATGPGRFPVEGTSYHFPTNQPVRQPLQPMPGNWSEHGNV